MNQKNVKINIYQVFMLICVQVILKATFVKMIFSFCAIKYFVIHFEFISFILSKNRVTQFQKIDFTYNLHTHNVQLNF